MVFIPLKCQNYLCWNHSVWLILDRCFYQTHSVACFYPWSAEQTYTITNPVVSTAKPWPLQENGCSDADSREMWDPICHVVFSQSGLQKPGAALGNFLSRGPRADGWGGTSCGVGCRSLGVTGLVGTSGQPGRDQNSFPSRGAAEHPPKLQHMSQVCDKYKSIYV